MMFEHVVEATLPGMIAGPRGVPLLFAFFKADVPLANHTGGVALGLQLLRQYLHDILGREAEVMAVIGTTEPTLMHPGQQPCTRRPTLRRGHVASGKTHTGCRQTIKIRGSKILHPLATQVVIAKVIGHNQQDVWPCRVCC